MRMIDQAKSSSRALSQCKDIAPNRKQKIARVEHRHHFPIVATGVMAWTEPLQTSTSNTFARKWKPKRTRRRGECLCSYYPRKKQNWPHLLKNPQTKWTFGHSYLVPSFPFSTEQLANNKACATLASIRPHPERVRARLALPRSQPHIFYPSSYSGLSHALRNARIVSTADSKCKFKFTSTRLEF